MYYTQYIGISVHMYMYMYCQYALTEESITHEGKDQRVVDVEPKGTEWCKREVFQCSIQYQSQ